MLFRKVLGNNLNLMIIPQVTKMTTKKNPHSGRKVDLHLDKSEYQPTTPRISEFR